MISSDRDQAGGSRKAVILSLYRPLDIRLMVSTGIVQKLSEEVDVVLLVPKPYVTELRKRLLQAVRVERLRLPTSKVRSDDLYTGYTGGWRGYLRDRLAEIAELTYADHGTRNESGVLVRSQYLRRSRQLLGFASLEALSVWAIASLACHSITLRRLMQRLWKWSCPFRPHSDLYKEVDPVLFVTASAGLGVDGLVMAEAAAHGCHTAVVVQSWDKTSTKGYPPITPDHMLVWSDLTAKEAQVYLDMKPDQIHVVGAPVWDHYFGDREIVSREQFLRERGLASDIRSIVYISIGYPAHHDGNLAITEALLDALVSGKLPARTGLLFRPHPVYFEYAAEQAELFRIFKRYERSPYWHVDMPVGGSSAYFLDEEDSHRLANIFFHSDVCVQASSTQMIEAAIFDCMIVDVAFGRWRNKVFDIEISDLSLTHINRVRSTGAVNQVRSQLELIEVVGRLVERGDDGRADQRRTLVTQELSINRGTAAIATAGKLLEIARAI